MLISWYRYWLISCLSFQLKSDLYCLSIKASAAIIRCCVIPWVMGMADKTPTPIN
jgi:hypothetical protein